MNNIKKLGNGKSSHPKAGKTTTKVKHFAKQRAFPLKLGCYNNNISIPSQVTLHQQRLVSFRPFSI